MNNYDLLLLKLDQFIRKYYKNQLLRGTIYALTTLSAAYLLFSVLEYYGHFGKAVRGIFFFSFIALLLAVLTRYIVRPLFGLNRVGKVLSHKEASAIIGRHFPEVSDQLLNTLQLKELAGSNQAGKALIEASINQRSQKLSPIPFTQAVDFRSNVRYLRYLAVPFLILFVILFANFRIVTDAPNRILHYDKHFEREAPFSFEIVNPDLKALQSQDFPLELKITGEELPSEVYIEVKGNRYKMTKEGRTKFVHVFKNLQTDFTFNFWADEYYSDEKEFRVLPKPLLGTFEVQLEYPGYTGRKPEKIKNVGDLLVPEGTKVTWKFITRNTDEVSLAFSDEAIRLTEENNGVFEYSRKFESDNSYVLSVSNKEAGHVDSIGYRVSVISDAFPTITLEENRDSLNSRVTYFIGEIGDDYGFRNLTFYYRFTASEVPGRAKKDFEKTSIAIDPLKVRQQFFHVWDLLDKDLKPGDELEFYFEVYDNDGVNGPKKARSNNGKYKVPTLEQIEQEAKDNARDLKDDMEEALEQTKQLAKELKDLEKKLLDKKNLNWEDKKQIEDLLKKQESLKNQVEELKKQNELNNRRENEFKEQDQEILDKQKQLEELFKEVFNDELKKLMEELRQLMEQNNKDAIREQLEKMELNEKDLNNQLDRMLELYKQLEFDKRLTENLDKLEKLAEEQEKLSEETLKDSKNADSLKKQQEQLNKDFDSLKKEFDQLEDLNEEMENPNESFDNPEEEMKEIDSDMDGGMEELQKKDKKKASKKQKDASKKMKDLKKKMEEQMAQGEREQQTEDYNTLREILENLVLLSKDQESLMAEMSQVNNYNPRYVELVQQQKKITDDSRVIEDSLLALSKRVPALSSYINTELSHINDNMTRALSDFANRSVSTGRTRQQYAMTSMNNLAVMLSEILKDMQDQMQQGSGGGDSQCKKPKKAGNKGDMKKMQQMQKQLGDQLKKMKGQMENGEKPGSSGWAKMAAEQEAIRRMLQEMKKELEEQGKGKEAGDLQKTIEEMEKVEKDLVNKKLNLETIKRHKDIETRLLEHEKAEREREKDNKRESNEGKEEQKRLPPSLEEYLKQKEKESELLKTLPPHLKPYFKEKTREYFRNINQ